MIMISPFLNNPDFPNKGKELPKNNEFPQSEFNHANEIENNRILEEQLENIQEQTQNQLREANDLRLEQLVKHPDYLSTQFFSEHLPVNNGEWSGEPGDSIWRPDPEYHPKKSNPEGLSWQEILDKYGIDGIKFVDGEPDFSEISQGTVEIDDFTDSRAKNFAQADEKLAEQWNKEGRGGRTDWTADDVADYREQNNLTWHERSDMKTMDLVPNEVHNNIPHSGGISEAKKQTSNNGEQA